MLLIKAPCHIAITSSVLPNAPFSRAQRLALFRVVSDSIKGSDVGRSNAALCHEQNSTAFTNRKKLAETLRGEQVGLLNGY
jgi:hypothetical protein